MIDQLINLANNYFSTNSNVPSGPQSSVVPLGPQPSVDSQFSSDFQSSVDFQCRYLGATGQNFNPSYSSYGYLIPKEWLVEKPRQKYSAFAKDNSYYETHDQCLSWDHPGLNRFTLETDIQYGRKNCFMPLSQINPFVPVQLTFHVPAPDVGKGVRDGIRKLVGVPFLAFGVYLIYTFGRRGLVQLVINDNQSTHTASVHESVSLTATNLKNYYQDKKLENELAESFEWVLSLKETDDITQAAKRCQARLSNIDDFNTFFDPASKVMLRDAFALAWIGINDPKAQIKELRRELTDKDIKERLEIFKRHLYFIQREYNIDRNEVDNLQADNPACMSGTFNQLFAALLGRHDEVEVTFVNKATIEAKFSKLIKEYYLTQVTLQQKIQYAEAREALKEDEDPVLPLGLLSGMRKWISEQLHQEFDKFKGKINEYDQHIKTLLEFIEQNEEVTAIVESLKKLHEEQQKTTQLVSQPPLFPQFERSKSGDKESAKGVVDTSTNLNTRFGPI